MKQLLLIIGVVLWIPVQAQTVTKTFRFTDYKKTHYEVQEVTGKVTLIVNKENKQIIEFSIEFPTGAIETYTYLKEPKMEVINKFGSTYRKKGGGVYGVKMFDGSMPGKYELHVVPSYAKIPFTTKYYFEGDGNYVSYYGKLD